MDSIVRNARNNDSCIDWISQLIASSANVSISISGTIANYKRKGIKSTLLLKSNF